MAAESSNDLVDTSVLSSYFLQHEIISYSMHGFYRGCPGIDDAIIPNNPDLFLQEHWLTPSNLLLPENRFTDYFCFRCSAISTNVETGMLPGRHLGVSLYYLKQ